MIDKNKKYLVSCSRFVAPDGHEYVAVWGKVEIIDLKDFLGFPPAIEDINFVIKVSGESKHMYITGYRIDTMVESEEKPAILEVPSGAYRGDYPKTYIIP